MRPSSGRARSSSILAQLSLAWLTACSPALRDGWYSCDKGRCPASLPFCHSDGICRATANETPRMDASIDAGEDSAVSLIDVRSGTDLGFNRDSEISRDTLVTADAATDRSAQPEIDATVSIIDSGTPAADVSTPMDVAPSLQDVAPPPPDVAQLDAIAPSTGTRVFAFPRGVFMSSLATGPGASVWATGSITSAVTLGTTRLTPAGRSDGFVLRYTPPGIEAFRIGGPGDERPTSMELGDDGLGSSNVYLTGTVDNPGDLGCGGTPPAPTGGPGAFYGIFSSSGTCRAQTFIQADELGAPSLALNATGTSWIGASISGTVTWSGTTVMYATSTDLGWARYESNGAAGTVRRGGGNGTQMIVDVIDDGAGGMWIAGNFDVQLFLIGAAVLSSIGSWDVFLLHVGPSGDPIDTFHFAGPNADYAVALAKRAGGGVWLLGNYSARADLTRTVARSMGSSDFFVVGVDGPRVESATYGGAEFRAEGRALATDAVGNLWVTGVFEERINLAGSTHASAGEEDIFVLSMTPTLVHRSAFRLGGIRSDVPVAIVSSLQDGNVWLAGELGPVPVDFGLETVNGLFTPAFLFAVRN